MKSWCAAYTVILLVRTVAFTAFATTAAATDGFWTAGSGSWANGANWDEGDIADGTDDVAYFGILANIPANMFVTLDGARTIGHLFFTDSSGADGVTLNTGSGGPLTMSATLDTPSITVAPANQQVTINTVLAGVDGLEKLSGGTLILAATNTYSGDTILGGGTLRVNGQIGPGSVFVTGGVLNGTGSITGPVTVQSGSVLAPGNSIGTLMISNTLTLESGSNTRIEVNASSLACDAVRGLSNVVYSGTLVVSNLADTPTLGQSFQIFNAAGASGNFANLTAQLGGGLRWKFEPISGVLSVVSATSQPVIASVAFVATNVVLLVTNGPPGATNFLLSSTNLSLPLTNWSRLATNKFDVSGNFAFTNSLNVNPAQRFYRISVLAAP